MGEGEEVKKLVRLYMGVGFSVFLALLPKNAVTVVQKLRGAEEEVRVMRRRRQEDSKANARVVEIFASHRNTWQAEEKRLLSQIDAAEEEIASLRERVAELEREVRERDEMISFMSRRTEEDEEEEEERVVGSTRNVEVVYEHEHTHLHHHQDLPNAFDSEFMASASKFCAEKSSLWQDVQYESLESMYNTKHFVARRESPWKVDGGSAGVSSKLKLLEQELLNVEKIGNNDLAKMSSLIKKQTKRYQTLSEKIDDLCRRIASDTSEPTLSSEFRAQTQTEFLLEAFRLQQSASETGQKLMALQTEMGKSHYRDELRSEATTTPRRSLDSIRSNFREIQRNLEIWLARVIGDLEGILARDGASRVREYYISRYPFVQ